MEPVVVLAGVGALVAHGPEQVVQCRGEDGPDGRRDEIDPNLGHEVPVHDRRSQCPRWVDRAASVVDA